MKKKKAGFWNVMFLKTTWKEKGQLFFVTFTILVVLPFQYWDNIIYQGREFKGSIVVLAPFAWICMVAIAATLFFTIHRDAKQRTEAKKDQ